jgi:arsenate reductase
VSNKLKVAFICVHNSCRSQIAEALGKHFAGDIFESYSAGTETKPQINQDAVRLMKELYDIDMEKTQHSKLLDEIPPVDIVITMGCNVECPYLPCKHREDWGLDDPTGKSDEEFKKVISTIETKIRIPKVKRHCQTSGRKSFALENPLFINVLSSPIFPPLEFAFCVLVHFTSKILSYLFYPQYCRQSLYIANQNPHYLSI